MSKLEAGIQQPVHLPVMTSIPFFKYTNVRLIRQIRCRTTLVVMLAVCVSLRRRPSHVTSISVTVARGQTVRCLAGRISASFLMARLEIAALMARCPANVLGPLSFRRPVIRPSG